MFSDSEAEFEDYIMTHNASMFVMYMDPAD